MLQVFHVNQDLSIRIPDDKIVGRAVHFRKYVLIASKLIQNAKSVGQDGNACALLRCDLRVGFEDEEVDAIFLQGERQSKSGDAAASDDDSERLFRHGSRGCGGAELWEAGSLAAESYYLAASRVVGPPRGRFAVQHIFTRGSVRIGDTIQPVALRALRGGVVRDVKGKKWGGDQRAITLRREITVTRLCVSE